MPDGGSPGSRTGNRKRLADLLNERPKQAPLGPRSQLLRLPCG